MEQIIAGVIEKSLIGGAFLFLLYHNNVNVLGALREISGTLNSVVQTLNKMDLRMEQVEKRIDKVEEKI
jgi:hypothetical protein